MSMDYSCALIVPESLQDSANRLACALGYDESLLPGRTYSVPLSADGQQPATHYGCHTWAGVEFIQMIQGAAQGQLPPAPWANWGLTEQAVFDVVAGLASRIEYQGDPSANFETLLAERGLQRIVSQES